MRDVTWHLMVHNFEIAAGIMHVLQFKMIIFLQYRASFPQARAEDNCSSLVLQSSNPQLDKLQKIRERKGHLKTEVRRVNAGIAMPFLVHLSSKYRTHTCKTEECHPVNLEATAHMGTSQKQPRRSNHGASAGDPM